MLPEKRKSVKTGPARLRHARLSATDPSPNGPSVVGRAGTELAAAALLIAVGCTAQEGVNLSGIVRDPSGSRIPHVLVRLSDPVRELTEVTIAGADGSFRIDGLTPSPSYQMEVQGPAGFEPSVRGLELAADQEVEVTLGIKPISEAIVIAGSRPAPQPGESSNPRRRVRVGGNVRRARLVDYVPPVYPAEAERDGVEGTVLLEAVIGEEGQLVGVSTLNPEVDGRLAAAASDAVLQWRYDPTLLNGSPVEVAVTVSVAFELP